MRKYLSLLLSLVLFISLFGCTKEETNIDEDDKNTEKPETVVVEPYCPPEEEFFQSIPEQFYVVFQNIQIEFNAQAIPMQMGIWENNKLRFEIPTYSCALYFSYLQEDGNFSVDVVQYGQQDTSLIKEICIGACDLRVISIAPTILKMALENKTLEYQGSLYSQSDNIFTIQIHGEETIKDSALKSCLTVFNQYNNKEIDCLQLALNAYARVHKNAYNSILSKGTTSNLKSFTDKTSRFIENEDNCMRMDSETGKTGSISYKDLYGGITVHDGEKGILFNPELALDYSADFISFLSLNQLIKLDLLKENSVDCMVMMTNTTMLVTVQGKTCDDNMNYNGTIIITEDEISVSEIISYDTQEQRENYTYNFEAIDSAKEFGENIYGYSFDYPSLFKLLKKYL